MQITYPVLLYNLTENTTLGICVGTEYRVTERDGQRVKDALSDYLKRNYKKRDDYRYFDIADFKMKMVGVNVRPNYTDDDGNDFPAKKELRVEVPVIFGENTENGNYECQIPLLDGRFYYYDARQMKVLAQHFITAQLNRMSPDEVYRLMGYGTPRLEKVTLKINENREIKGWGGEAKQDFPQLNRLCEEMPLAKSDRRKRTALPQTAWELKDKVTELYEAAILKNANVLLVGKRGSGKSAILQQFARIIAADKKTNNEGKTLYRMLPQRLTYGAKYLGEWQEAADGLIRDLQNADGLLWIPDIVRLLQTGDNRPETGAAAYLQPFIREGKMQVIGEITPEELDGMRRLLPGFAESFQILNLGEMPETKVFGILHKLAEFFDKNQKVTVTQPALQTGYRLLKRYFPYESFPGKGIKFFGRLVDIAVAENRKRITKDRVIDLFTEQTGLPELFLRDEIPLQKEQLRSDFNAQIIGQPAAVEKISNIIQIFKAGLNNPYKPIAVLLFAGPTGVGKTATARVLSEFFFGQKKDRRRGQNPLVRIDMSEYRHPMQITNFLGDGNRPGALVHAVRRRPFSVVLLDEIEKAADNIFDALLTVLDEGVMTDNLGRKTNFRNTVIIMTSNVGATTRQAVGFSETLQTGQKYDAALRKQFKPEFLNRLDAVVTFNNLRRADIEKITRKELEALQKREGFQKRSLTLTFSEALIAHIADTGFDEKYGARPLQRAVEQEVMQKVALWLAENEVNGGGLELDWKEGLQIKKST